MVWHVQIQPTGTCRIGVFTIEKIPPINGLILLFKSPLYLQMAKGPLHYYTTQFLRLSYIQSWVLWGASVLLYSDLCYLQPRESERIDQIHSVKYHKHRWSQERVIKEKRKENFSWNDLCGRESSLSLKRNENYLPKWMINVCVISNAKFFK